MEQLVARYNVTPIQHADGGSPELQSDGYGRLLVSTIGSGGGDASAANQTNGLQISQVYSAAKGATASTAVTSTANGPNHQGLDVVEQFMPSAEDNTNGVLAEQWKPLAVSTYTPSLYTNFAGSVTKALISAGSHNAFSFVVTNTNAAVRYLQLHNKATAPVATDVPLVSFPVPAVGSLVLGDQWFTRSGVNFALGLGWAISTTVGTFTDAATAAEHTVQITYK